MAKIIHEVRYITFGEIGGKLDNMLEEARADFARCDGGKQALAHGRKMVEELTKHIDKDAQEGSLTLEEVSLAKKYVLRAMGVLENLGIQAEVQSYQAQGKMIALEQSIKLTKVLYDAEKKKFEMAELAEKEVLSKVQPDEAVVEERPAPDARVPGTHPGNPIADRREQDLVEIVSTPKKKRPKE